MKEAQKGIPIPAPVHGGGRPVKYPWASFEVGDSFILDSPKGYVAYAQALSAAKKYGIKVSVRKTPEGYRVWRVE